MNSVTGRSKSVPSQKRMSRFVRMPTSRPSGSVIGTPGELEPVHQRLGVVQQRRRRQRDRVGDHARLRPLHLLDLGRLVVDRHVAVDHADAAVAGHRDRHAALGDLVHRRGHERHGEFDVGGEAGGRVDGVRQRLGVAGHDDDIVERQRLEAVEELVVDIGAAWSVMRGAPRIPSGGCGRS